MSWQLVIKEYQRKKALELGLSAGLITPQCIITHRFSLEHLDKGKHPVGDKSQDYIKVMAVMG